MSRCGKGRGGGKKVGAAVRASTAAIGNREAEEGCRVAAWRVSALIKVWVVSAAAGSEVH